MKASTIVALALLLSSCAAVPPAEPESVTVPVEKWTIDEKKIKKISDVQRFIKAMDITIEYKVGDQEWLKRIKPIKDLLKRR